MSTTTTPGLPILIPENQVIATQRPLARKRQISPDAGHALEILGHAIEYLTDEFVHEGVFFSTQDGRLDAVQLLMSLNRRVYLACPEVPTFRERCAAFLRLRRS